MPELSDCTTGRRAVLRELRSADITPSTDAATQIDLQQQTNADAPRVLSGEDWSLGEDVGTLSSDGKKLSGTGKDALGGSLGMSYQFSFTKK